ncbi:hypothetical protein [Maricaulis sp. CAU 1757]
MTGDTDGIRDRIRALQDKLEERLTDRRRAFGYRMHRGRLVISRRVRAHQATLKIGLRRYLMDSGALAVLTSPFIYAVVAPLGLLDIIVSLYQSVCFRVYGLQRVSRRRYVVFDRHRLPYLNAFQKLNCLYCSYANGVIAYTAEIASRTEQYWCPIKHAERVEGTHRRYEDFLEYGDTADYPDALESQRNRLKGETGLDETP